MENGNRNLQDERQRRIDEVDEETASRNRGNNTDAGQRRADGLISGDKGKQGGGNSGSRQGDGGNRGSRGNRGLG